MVNLLNVHIDDLLKRVRKLDCCPILRNISISRNRVKKRSENSPQPGENQEDSNSRTIKNLGVFYYNYIIAFDV